MGPYTALIKTSTVLRSGLGPGGVIIYIIPVTIRTPALPCP